MSTPFFVTVPDMYDGSARSRGLGWMYEAESDDASLSDHSERTLFFFFFSRGRVG